MMYLIVVLVASVLLNLFLFVDRQALSKENDKLEKQLRVTKKQVQTFRQAFAASCKQVQQLLQHQYIQLSIEDSEYDEILKLLLDRLPVLLQSQVENGESHQVAMVTQKVTNVVSAEDFETFFKKKDRDM